MKALKSGDDIKYVSMSTTHLESVVRLCEIEEYGSYADRKRAWGALSAPGVTTVVAVSDGKVLGFAQLQSDGLIQAHLSLIVVDRRFRRRGIGRRLVEEAFRRAGGQRIDLVSTEGNDQFYESFQHRRFPGFRIYPRGRKGRASSSA